MLSDTKYSIKFNVGAPILAEGFSGGEKFRIKIGSAFFVSFFAQAKKENTHTFKGKVVEQNLICMGDIRLNIRHRTGNPYTYSIIGKLFNADNLGKI